MDEILKNMDPDKRERIINSAIDEFSKYPYEKASTNNIVKGAEISKGLLFHYFGNKKELYEKVVGFVLNKLFSEITSQINWEQSDILERIKEIVILKLKIEKVYPNMFSFVVNMISETNTKNYDEITALYSKYGIDIQTLMTDAYTKNIDFSKFKDQSSIDKSINIVRWTLEKYSEEQILRVSSDGGMSFEKIALEIDQYIDVLKKALYK